MGITTIAEAEIFDGGIQTQDLSASCVTPDKAALSASWVFEAGLTGSIQHVSGGASYLVAGTNISIVSASNGQITVLSTAPTAGADDAASYIVVSNTGSLSNERALVGGTGIDLVDGGANTGVTASIDDSVVATLTGSEFSGDVTMRAGTSIGVHTTSASTAFIHLLGDDATQPSIFFDFSTNGFRDIAYRGRLQIGTWDGTTWTERAQFDSTGQLGIGATPDELLHTAKAVDGISIGLLIENSQANAGGSINESVDIQFGFGGVNDAARISVIKTEDFTVAANESAAFSFLARLNGATAETARLFADGTFRLLAPGGTAGTQIQFQCTPGGSSPFGPGILYLDSGSTLRNALMFPGSDLVVLSNRAANGTVEVRANTATAGDGGEVTVATFEDDEIRLLEAGGQVGIANGAGNSPQYRLDVGQNSYFAINGSFAHIVQHNSAASTFWSIAPRNGGDLDIAVTTTDPRPSGGTISTSNNAISIKANKDVQIVGLGVSADVQTDANSILITVSDARLKRIHGPANYGLDAVLGLEPVLFNYRTDPDDAQSNIGFVAQNVREHVPEAVSEDSKGYLSLNTRGVIAALVGAVKEQQEQIDSLRRQLEAVLSESTK